jgi:hypothetical protein
MSDSEEPKNSPQEGIEPAPASGKPAKSYSQTDFPVHVSFYDAATLKPMEPDHKLISFYHAGNKNSKIKYTPPEKSKGIFVLHGIEKPTLVEMILNGSFQRQCERFVSGVVAFMAKPGAKEGCRVHSPLFKLEESCRVRFHAYDSSDPDDIDDKEAQLEGVGLVLTAVPAPRGEHEPSIRNIIGRTYSASTVNGIAEMNGLPQRTLFRLEVRGLPNYICRNAPEFVQTCCDPQIEVDLPFQPCACLTAPTFVFVREGCAATRCSNLEFEIAGESFRADQYGIWTAPRELMGEVHLSHPQMAFSPSYFELNANTPPVFVVTVAERAQVAIGRRIRGRFVDDVNSPFARRPLAVLLPNGDEVEVMTDDDGYFEAPHGSRVYAREDKWGLATEPIYLTETV